MATEFSPRRYLTFFVIAGLGLIGSLFLNFNSSYSNIALLTAVAWDYIYYEKYPPFKIIGLVLAGLALWEAGGIFKLVLPPKNSYDGHPMLSIALISAFYVVWIYIIFRQQKKSAQ